MALGAAALTLALAVPGVAQAEWYFTKYGAQRAAQDFVADYYSNTYVSDITTYCQPIGRSYNPTYKYHRYRCAWVDRSDGTRGVVQIVGSGSPGA